ncbi:Uncharacterized protein PRO82_001541 [Candidatus Protochlamydia amoebophila]|nr:Uncharacterized protein [Candidatus Protochlamydia amoebophila]
MKAESIMILTAKRKLSSLASKLSLLTRICFKPLLRPKHQQNHYLLDKKISQKQAKYSIVDIDFLVHRPLKRYNYSLINFHA